MSIKFTWLGIAVLGLSWLTVSIVIALIYPSSATILALLNLLCPLPVREETEEDIRVLLEGSDAAWEQYKRNQSTKVASSSEFDAFLDSCKPFHMVRKRSLSKPKPDQATIDTTTNLHQTGHATPLAAGLVTFFFLGCYRFAKLGLDEYIDQLALPPSQEEAKKKGWWQFWK